ncbi:MAG: hypothetical protein J6L73_04995, partial [Muribaculaceae bacterium]|nr:hypothetical protein [Muribaculaceae bacterium]
RPFSELTKYFCEKITEKLQPYRQYSVNHTNTEVLKYVKTCAAIELFRPRTLKKQLRQTRLNPLTRRSRRTLASKKTQKSLGKTEKTGAACPAPALCRLSQRPPNYKTCAPACADAHGRTG